MSSLGKSDSESDSASARTASKLRSYALAGRRGLRICPISLGAGTFGDGWDPAWQSPPEQVDRILDAYVDAGGNVIDTADRYQNGRSEELVGAWLRKSGRRDDVVLATKYGYGAPGDVHQGGNARLTLQRALEGSLRRLQTDVIDLYHLHLWDTFTPVDEVMATLDACVRAGKIRYVGLSNVPAWYLGRAQTLAEWRGWEPVAVVQVNYSLLARTIEYEFVDAAQELGIGLTAWSPLANGLLSGKYRVNEEGRFEGDGRVTKTWITDNTVYSATAQAKRVLETLQSVASELGQTPARVALNWVTNRPGVVSTVIGARTEAQLQDNLAALDFELPDELAARLEEVSRPPEQYPYSFFTDAFHDATVRSGLPVRREPRGFRGRGYR
ncbi:MAG TPA: aldo/keto reductase [Enhygromyxa sp.]|nr:aldo/keto reductase [Enhygromyxa sp.]